MDENDLPIIPKPLKRYRGTIFMFLTWFDLGILAISIVLSILVWVFAADLSYWTKLAFTVVLITSFSSLLVTYEQTKLYVYIFRGIAFLFAKKTYETKESVLLNPYDSIEDDGLLKLKNGQYIRPIMVTGFNIHILQLQEQLSRINSFRTLTQTTGLSYSIAKINTKTSLDPQRSIILDSEKLTKKDKEFKAYKKPLELSLKVLDTLEDKELDYSDKYMILLFGDKKHISQNLNRITSALNLAFLKPEITNKKQSLELLKNSFSNHSKDSTVKKLTNTKTIFKANHIETNGKYVKIFAVSEFARFANIGWLSSLSIDQSISWNIQVETFDKAKAKKKIDKTIKSLEEKRYSAKKASEATTSDSYLQGLYQLNEQLNTSGETINSTYTFVKVEASSKKQLDDLNRLLKNEAASMNIKINGMKFLQKEGWSSFMPKPSTPTKRFVSVELSSIALAYSFPFYSEIHKDDKGVYLGYSNTGNNVFFDPWVRDSQRQNSNIVILGTSGAGKSTLSKKMMKDQVITQSLYDGKKIIAIDPEREYKQLCEAMNGTWINFGSDSSMSSKKKEAIINPLQFLKSETDDRRIMASHVEFLEQFFKTLFPELQLSELQILKRTILELYKSKKISDSSSSWKSKDFPIISDLAKLINKNLKSTKDEIEKMMFKKLSIFFGAFLTDGPEKALWDGHTNIEFHKSNFVVMDIFSLYESGNQRIANSQMFLLLKLVNNAMVQNKILLDKEGKAKRLMIVVDEAHLLVDEKQPEAINFLYQMVKRARKYYAQTTITTQNIKDFVGGSEEIKKKTSAIINTSQYAFLLKMNSGDIEDLDNVYSSTGGLTEIEKQTLSQAEVGQLILAIGSKDRKIIQVDIADEELEIWERRANV